MDVRWLVSGEHIATVASGRWESLSDLKRLVATEVRASRFRVRLTDCSGADLVESDVVGETRTVECRCHVSAETMPNLQQQVPERPLRASDRPEPLYFVKSLLEVGASVDFADVDGDTALVVAVRANDTALARLLLDQTADPNVASGGGAPLQLAAGGNSVEMIRLLLSARADVDGPEPGQAPIMEAARGNHWEATFCLWHHGADVRCREPCAETRCRPTRVVGSRARAGDAAVWPQRRGDEAPWGKRWA
eukprot:s851_g2.t1